jgi:hypothetical protein
VYSIGESPTACCLLSTRGEPSGRGVNTEHLQRNGPTRSGQAGEVEPLPPAERGGPAAPGRELSVQSRSGEPDYNSGAKSLLPSVFDFKARSLEPLCLRRQATLRDDIEAQASYPAEFCSRTSCVALRESQRMKPPLVWSGSTRNLSSQRFWWPRPCAWRVMGAQSWETNCMTS